MKKRFYIVLILAAAVLTMQCQHSTPDGQTDGNRRDNTNFSEEKIYGNIDLNGDFADDRLVVVLNKESR